MSSAITTHRTARRSKRIRSDTEPSSPSSQPLQTADRFAVVKELFHQSSSTRIIGRTDERVRIERFWRAAVAEKRGGVLYICGNPGTGKTALVQEMLPGLLASGSADVGRCVAAAHV